MIIVDNALVSEDILEKHFVCDLAACKGACCVDGESGAPLEQEEIAILENILDEVKPYMSEAGRKVVEQTGVCEVDGDGDFVTPLIDGKECAFAFFDERGIAKCAIEKAFREGKTDFPKPLSCHLYPIRITPMKDFTAVNYHHWPICDPARSCGVRLEVPVFRFLKEPIIRKFGSEFFKKLEAAATILEAGDDDEL